MPKTRSHTTALIQGYGIDEMYLSSGCCVCIRGVKMIAQVFVLGVDESCDCVSLSDHPYYCFVLYGLVVKEKRSMVNTLLYNDESEINVMGIRIGIHFRNGAICRYDSYSIRINSSM